MVCLTYKGLSTGHVMLQNHTIDCRRNIKQEKHFTKKSDIEARFCRGKAVSIKYYDSVSVFLP